MTSKRLVLARVPAIVLQQTVTSAKALLRPEDFDSPLSDRDSLCADT
ncbi:hypothetical protein [Reticulibacter mediterranei]|nr:hypothetical protein [Reticulibacter mediterranei]